MKKFSKTTVIIIASVAFAVIAITIATSIAINSYRNGRIIVSSKADVQLALTATEKCFPPRVFDYLMETELSIKDRLDPDNELPKNLNAYAIDDNLMVWIAAPLIHKNNGPTRTGVFQLGGTSMTGPIAITDETGEILKHRLVKQKRPSFYQLYVQLNSPWKTGDEKIFYWVGQHHRGGKLSKNSQGRYPLTIQQHFGPEAIQQLALVLPRGWQIVSETEEPISVEQVGDFEITIWAKHVQRDENHRVDVVIESN